MSHALDAMQRFAKASTVSRTAGDMTDGSLPLQMFNVTGTAAG
jgi:hypothetical protein